MSKILIVVSLLLTIAAVGAQEANSTTPDLPEVRQTGKRVASPTEFHTEGQAVADPNRVEISPTVVQPPLKSDNSQSAQDEQKPPVTRQATSASQKSDSPNSNFVKLLPWCIAVFMAVLTGAAGTYIIILKKQERHFAELRAKVLNGITPVHLLPEEATRLIHQFQVELREGVANFDETIKRQRQELERIIQKAEETSAESQRETKQIVDTFKGSLNEMLGKIGKFMERVVHDTKETRNEALETKEFARQVSALIADKELEIAKLKEGYHIHLISPLTSGFLKIRDDIHTLADHTSDAEIRQQLSDLDQRIGDALSDLKIEEIPIHVGEKPHDIHHSRLWESLGAAVATDDPLQHGAVARIQERGYQFTTNNGEPHIIRKAVVVIHCCSTLNGQPGA